LAIEVSGNVHLWDNNFANHRTPGGTHGTAGLADLAGGGPDADRVDLKLEIDPVNTKARGYVNDMVNPVVEIDYVFSIRLSPLVSVTPALTEPNGTVLQLFPNRQVSPC